MNKRRALAPVVDTFTQGIEGSCSCMTELLKKSEAFFSASSLDFSGRLSFLQNSITSRSYLVKTAMMGMLTIIEQLAMNQQSSGVSHSLATFSRLSSPTCSTLAPVRGVSMHNLQNKQQRVII
jgi:hypothetical protein